MSASARYELVPLGDLELRCLRAGDDVWLPFSDLCEVLGIRMHDEAVRLADPVYKDVVQFRTEMTANGRSFSLPHIHYLSVPVWLNMIDLRRFTTLPAKLRQLQTIQKECARAIERHFFGGERQDVGKELACSVSPEDLLVQQAILLRDQRRRLEQIEARQDRGEVEQAETKTLAEAAFRNSAIGPAQTLKVLACLIAWKLDSSNRNAAKVGKAVRREADRLGLTDRWRSEHQYDGKAASSDWAEVNEWPAPFILGYFTDRYGPCPLKRYRELYEATKDNDCPF